jgi:hypothetical protein
MTRHSYQVESGEHRPDMDMTALIVTGSPAGAMAVVAIGFVGIPEARPLLLASGGLGILLWLYSLLETPLILLE